MKKKKESKIKEFMLLFWKALNLKKYGSVWAFLWLISFWPVFLISLLISQNYFLATILGSISLLLVAIIILFNDDGSSVAISSIVNSILIITVFASFLIGLMNPVFTINLELFVIIICITEVLYWSSGRVKIKNKEKKIWKTITHKLISLFFAIILIGVVNGIPATYHKLRSIDYLAYSPVALNALKWIGIVLLIIGAFYGYIKFNELKWIEKKRGKK